LTAKSEILPDAHAGPILLNDNPPNVEEVSPASFFSGSFAASFFFWAIPGFIHIKNPKRNVMKRPFFIIVQFNGLGFFGSC
jgi:hypothetical protein